MPVVIRNKTNSIQIDISTNLKYEVSKGGYDVIYEDIGDGIPIVYVILRSGSTLRTNTIPLDWRDCSSPDATFTSAENLRDTLLEWNIPKTSINDSALPSGAATSAKQDTGNSSLATILENQTDGDQAAQFVDENGTPYGVKHINNKPRVSAMPYLYDIAEGNVSGHESWSKIGFNGDVDVGTEDMIAQGGLYVFPASAIQMDIVSSSAEDDPAKADTNPGTGIHTVTLYYLDADGVEHTEDINLNGTAAVATVATNIYRVQNMRAKVCGTGGAAAGNITLSEHSGTTYKYGYIMTGHTRMRQCVWTVPAGKTLYITSISFAVGGAAATKTAIFTTVAKYDNKAGAARTFFLPYNEVIVEDGTYHRELEIPTKLPAGTDLKVRVQSYTADSICTCSLRGWLETD